MLLQCTQPDHSSEPVLRLRLPLSLSQKASAEIQQHSEFYFHLRQILSLKFDQFIYINMNGNFGSRIIDTQIQHTMQISQIMVINT